ncbi:sensor histidine kinase [Pseudoteredinibacter isoporae]|uniref:sensor histidine kinase n=1 Tax=Pseudoteredinibacter isoporae TaxID=570281 RepID=UPI00310A2E63
MNQEEQSVKLMRSSIFSTLSAKLSLALVLIVATLGIGVFVASQAWMRVYYDELTQKLNFDIAKYVNGEYQLIQDESNTPSTEAIKQVAHVAMVVNPVVEVYLLDVHGHIIGHDLPPDSVLLKQVPIEPIQAFINGTEEFPLRGQDPRQPDVEKVFSAAAIENDGQLQGYLYVILGGQAYDNIGDGLKDSYSRTMVFTAIALITLVAVLTGLLVFRLLVRRLSALSHKMHNFARHELPQVATDPIQQAVAKDEIELLQLTFGSMSGQIKQQFELLREADATRRELISNVSHDLRTPLATIQGYLETLLIKNGTLNEAERLEYLNTAMKSSRRLGQLIGDLFELSKLESNHTRPNFERFSLAELVFDTAQEFRLELEAKQIKLDIHNEQNNALVFADISLMQRVFENLLRNAIAYTPEGGLIQLGIVADPNSPQKIKVTVGDTGRGISEEDLPYIFDRFYANPDRSREDVSSTGLGLAIVKRIMDIHEANIQVKSKINQGTRFEFALPKEQAA